MDCGAWSVDIEMLHQWQMMDWYRNSTHSLAKRSFCL